MTDYDYNDSYDDERPEEGKRVRGYQIVIIALAAIMVAMAFIFFRQTSNIREDEAAKREIILGEFSSLKSEYDNLQTNNDALNTEIAATRGRADSIMERLNNERRLSAGKLRQYEKEIATLRGVMRGYVSTIDSLNRLNTNLIAENRNMREEVTTERLRADKAEETVGELSTKVRQGSVIRAREINIVPLSANDRALQRANRAEQLRVDCVLSANELSEPGERPIYVRVTAPDGVLLANNAGAAFDFEGEQRAYTAVREIDYQNQDIAVSLYYKGGGIVAGKYAIEIYIDGYLIGSREVSLR